MPKISITIFNGTININKLKINPLSLNTLQPKSKLQMVLSRLLQAKNLGFFVVL